MRCPFIALQILYAQYPRSSSSFCVRRKTPVSSPGLGADAMHPVASQAVLSARQERDKRAIQPAPAAFELEAWQE